MSKSARTIYVFFVYMIISGAAFVFAPNLAIVPLGFPEAHELWVRVVGMLTIILGSYYGVMARHEVRPFFMATVYGRLSVSVFFAGFVLAKLAPPILLGLGLIDLLGAIWTWRALRDEAKFDLL
ncbi:MAG: hypothetical protein LDL37_13790 [Asticcacaulis sp.]|uniref:hypothetical protein n=1 Tax=Asticcacaulis sp. TaxID=1872648 RepID=UPI0025BA3F1D|nr:hypothetical protein [Asticcacaulis sp.]MCA1936517.1 hypothetical protein [Asticcacaulis sp.]